MESLKKFKIHTLNLSADKWVSIADNLTGAVVISPVPTFNLQCLTTRIVSILMDLHVNYYMDNKIPMEYLGKLMVGNSTISTADLSHEAVEFTLISWLKYRGGTIYYGLQRNHTLKSTRVIIMLIEKSSASSMATFPLEMSYDRVVSEVLADMARVFAERHVDISPETAADISSGKYIIGI